MTLNNFETGSKSTLVCNFIVVAQTMEAWAKDAIENLILLNRQETYKSVGKFVNLTKLRNVMVLGISRSTALVSRLSTFSKLCQTFTPLKQTKNKSNQTAKTKYQKLCSTKKNCFWCLLWLPPCWFASNQACSCSSFCCIVCCCCCHHHRAGLHILITYVTVHRTQLGRSRL